MHSHPDFGLAQSRVLARREAHVAGEDELAAHAIGSYLLAQRTGLSSQGSNVTPDMKASNPGKWLWGCYVADQKQCRHLHDVPGLVSPASFNEPFTRR